MRTCDCKLCSGRSRLHGSLVWLCRGDGRLGGGTSLLTHTSRRGRGLDLREGGRGGREGGEGGREGREGGREIEK